MKETPIIMSTPMVKAILEGRKTCTRRVIKPQPGKGLRVGNYYSDDGFIEWVLADKYGDVIDALPIKCPYGQVGDRLWVRETFRINAIGGASYKADEGASWIGKWKPSIHMFKKYARIWLEITGVRADRLQEITELDAKAEGVTALYITAPQTFGAGYIHDEMGYRRAFHKLWDSLNAQRGYGWDTNPWVWVIDYKVING